MSKIVVVKNSQIIYANGKIVWLTKRSKTKKVFLDKQLLFSYFHLPYALASDCLIIADKNESLHFYLDDKKLFHLDEGSHNLDDLEIDKRYPLMVKKPHNIAIVISTFNKIYEFDWSTGLYYDDEDILTHIALRMMIGGWIKFKIIEVDKLLLASRSKFQTLEQFIKEVVTTYTQKYISQTYAIMQHSHLFYFDEREIIAQKIRESLAQHLLLILSIQLEYFSLDSVSIPPYYLEMIKESLFKTNVNS